MTFHESKEVTLNVEDLQDCGEVTYLGEEYDNPQHQKLETNFLSNNINFTNNLNGLYSKSAITQKEIA